MRKNDIKVSVIVPVYNTERYLARCLDSLTSQSLRKIEIILVNDGSTDRSATICLGYMARDGRIRVISKPNAGLGMARNSGLEAASGEYVAFVDSDDYVSPYMMEILYEIARRHEAEAVLCGYTRVSEGYETRYPLGSSDRQVSGKGNLTGICLDMVASAPGVSADREIPMSACFGIYSRKAIMEHGVRFRSERDYICEDLLFNISLLPCLKRVRMITETLYYYCDNGGSLTNIVREDRLSHNEKVYHKITEELLNLGVEDRIVRERADRFIIGYNRYTLARIVASDMGYEEKMAQIRGNGDNRIWGAIHKRYPVGMLPARYWLIQSLVATRRHHLLYMMLWLHGKASVIKERGIAIWRNRTRG